MTSVAAGSREEDGVGCQNEGGSGPKARAKRGGDETRRRPRRRRAGEEVEERRAASVGLGLIMMLAVVGGTGGC